MTTYTADWNMKDVYRGDTIDAFAITLKEQDSGDVIIPKSVCAQIRDNRGSVAHQYEVFISASGRCVFSRVDSDITRDFATGVYKFDIEYTLQDDKVRTYLAGRLRVLEDVSRCHAN